MSHIEQGAWLCPEDMEAEGVWKSVNYFKQIKIIMNAWEPMIQSKK